MAVDEIRKQSDSRCTRLRWLQWLLMAVDFIIPPVLSAMVGCNYLRIEVP